MAAKGYSSVDRVRAEMNEVFTPDQQTECAELLEYAENFIDRKTGREWIVVSPATEVMIVPDDGVVRLTARPVTAITSVVARPLVIGASSTPLVADSTYELIDAQNGTLLVSPGYMGNQVTIAYTHTDMSVPGDIRHATTMLVAHWMLPRIHPERAGLSKIIAGEGELELTILEKDIPPEVMRLINARTAIIFA